MQDLAGHFDYTFLHDDIHILSFYTRNLGSNEMLVILFLDIHRGFSLAPLILDPVDD